jgi:hypothetical protein
MESSAKKSKKHQIPVSKNEKSWKTKEIKTMKKIHENPAAEKVRDNGFG